MENKAVESGGFPVYLVLLYENINYLLLIILELKKVYKWIDKKLEEKASGILSPVFLTLLLC